MRPTPAKPPRTLGIALAIILSTLFYAVLPLGFVGFTVSLQARIQTSGVSIGTRDGVIPGGALGFSSISTVELGIWAGLALGFLVVAVLAWRGGGPRIRYLFIGAVTLAPLAYGGLWAYRGYRDAQRMAELGALQGSGVPSICNAAFALPLLVTIYVVWYLNRGPARAFYRGYYLRREDDTAHHEKAAP